MGPEELMKITQRMHAVCKKRFKIFGSHGKEVTSQRGAIQGCSISSFLMNLTSVAWHRLIKNGLSENQYEKIVPTLREKKMIRGCNVYKEKNVKHLLTRGSR